MNQRRVIKGALLVVALLVIWLFVLPPQLGGRTILLTTRGDSMEPLLHEGDVAILRKQSTYKIGDIVQFHSKSVNAPLLHRITSVDDRGYTTKGDNTNFHDLFHPTDADINGKLVHHIDGGGKFVGLLKSWPVKILGAILIGWAAYNLTRNLQTRNESDKPSRRNPFHSLPQMPSFSFSKPGHRSKLMVIFGVITAGSLALSALAFSIPIKSSGTFQTIYNTSGKFAYSAHASGGELVYRDGQVSTGDPIFRAMVKEVFVTFDFKIESPSKFKGSGDLAVNAVIEGAAGWKHEIPMVAKTEFSNGTVRAGVVYNIAQMQGVVERIQQLTQIPEKSYKVSIRPIVNVDGTLGGGRLKTNYAPNLTFNVSTAQITVEKGSGNQKESPADESSENVRTMNGLSTSGGGTITIPAGTKATITAFGNTVAVATMRVVGLGGILFGLMGLLALLITRPRNVKTAPEAISKRHSRVIIPVDNLDALPSTVIEVPDFDSLYRLAEQHGELILSHSQEHSETYAISASGLTYRYIHHTLTSRFDTPSQESTEAK